MSRRRGLFIAAGAAGLLMLTFTVAWAAGTLSPKEQLGKAIFFDQNLSLNRNLRAPRVTARRWGSPVPTR